MIYHDYAPIYHALGQGAFAEALAERILAALPAPPRRVLDLACGTGAATLALATSGAEVVGVDRSPRMLAIARASALARGLPVTLIEADIRQLPSGHGQGQADPDRPASRSLPPAAFDLITCLYDSLNYLTGDHDLELALEGAARLLRPGGRLIFDLNTEHEFASWGAGCDQVVHDADGILVYNRLHYDHEEQLAYARIGWFVREGSRWRRGEEQHVERAWSEVEVGAALGSAGLRLLARYTPDWAPAAAEAPRVVYVATTADRQ